MVGGDRDGEMFRRQIQMKIDDSEQILREFDQNLREFKNL